MHRISSRNNYISRFSDFVNEILFYSIIGIFISGISVPSLVLPGEDVVLQCLYDLAGHDLYTLKWYHNENVIYRYMPRSHSEYEFNDNMKRLTLDVSDITY